MALCKMQTDSATLKTVLTSTPATVAVSAATSDLDSLPLAVRHDRFKCVNPRQRYVYIFRDRFGSVFAGAPLRLLIKAIAQASNDGDVQINEVRAFEKARLSAKSQSGYQQYCGFKVSRASVDSFRWETLPEHARIVLPDNGGVNVLPRRGDDE